MLRLITLTKNRISKTYKINKLFHKIKIFQKNKKRYCILNRSLIHLCNCLEGYIRQKLLIDYKGQFEKWVEIPLIIQIFWYFNDYHEFNGNSLDLSKKGHNTNIKFDFFKKKKNLILINKFHEDLFYRSNISNHILAYSDSYCSFYRNLKPNLYFILKFDKKSFEPGFKKFVLNIIDCCAFIEKNNQYSYILYKQISRKLGLKKFKFTPSLFFSTSGAEKHLINFNKSYIARLNYMAEEFYEKKKINSLLKLSLILVLTGLKFSLIFKKGKNYKKFVFGQIMSKKITYCKNSKFNSEIVNKIMDINENLFLFYKILIYTGLEKNKNRRILTDTISDVFFSNKIFTKLNSFKLNFKFVLLAVRKKKYILAYNLLRFQCSNNPYTVDFWQLFSWVEKEIGFAVSKTLRFALRVVSKYPDSIPGIIFSGNLCSSFGSNGYALAEFFQAYRWKSNSPFLNLSISIQYLNGSLNRRNNFKGYAVLLCLCFFFRYKILRCFIIQTILQKNFISEILSLEILYNSGRILLFLGIDSLAKINFDSVLKKKKTVSGTRKFNRIRKKSLELNIKQESYFNSLFLEECTEGISSNNY